MRVQLRAAAHAGWVGGRRQGRQWLGDAGLHGWLRAASTGCAHSHTHHRDAARSVRSCDAQQHPGAGDLPVRGVPAPAALGLLIGGHRDCGEQPHHGRTGLQSKHVSGVPLHTHTTPCSPHTQPWHANRLQARARCIGGRAINRPCAPPHCPPYCCLQAKWALPAIALYPLSLLTVHLLDTKLGWQ